MARTDKLIEAFCACSSTFSFRGFVKILGSLGYQQLKNGGGSGRRFFHPKTQDIIMLHEPHDDEMGRGMVERLRKELREKGVL